MAASKAQNFGFRDLIHTTPGRWKQCLSQIINFAKFREAKYLVYAQLTAEAVRKSIRSRSGFCGRQKPNPSLSSSAGPWGLSDWIQTFSQTFFHAILQNNLTEEKQRADREHMNAAEKLAQIQYVLQRDSDCFQQS